MHSQEFRFIDQSNPSI